MAPLHNVQLKPNANAHADNGPFESTRIINVNKDANLIQEEYSAMNLPFVVVGGVVVGGVVVGGGVVACVGPGGNMPAGIHMYVRMTQTNRKMHAILAAIALH